jgi:hypothetical protein
MCPDYNFAIPGLMELQTPVSNSIPQRLSLEPHNSQNTNWIGISEIGPFTRNGDPMPFPAARVIFTLYTRFGVKEPVWEIDSEAGADGLAVIEDAAAWFFNIPEQPLMLEPGLWEWDFAVTDSRGIKEKIYEGVLLIR